MEVDSYIMTAPAPIRLLVITADSLFSDYTQAAVDQCRDISVDCVSTLSAGRSSLATRPVDCVVLDDDLSAGHSRTFHRMLRTERPQFPFILAADRPQTSLPRSLSYHAFVRKAGPSMGTSLTNMVRILATAPRVDDPDTAPTAAD